MLMPFRSGLPPARSGVSPTLNIRGPGGFHYISSSVPFLETRSSGCARKQLKAKGLSLNFEMIETALFVSLFISLLTQLHIVCAAGQHRVIDARNFVRCGSDGVLASSA